LLGRFVELLGELGGLVLGIGSSIINGRGDTEELRAEEAGVENLSAPELRQSEPENEQGLEEVVEGEPVDKRIREEFDNLDETEDSPVGQPLFIVVTALGLDSLEGGVGRVDPANQVSQEVTCQVEEDGNEQDAGDTQDEGDLRDLGLVLNLAEPRVLGELLVELGVVLAQLGINLVYLRYLRHG